MLVAAQTMQAGFDAENQDASGSLFRVYDSEPGDATTRGVAPTGTILVEVSAPAPLFNPSSWSEGLKKLTATKASAALQKLSGNASGTARSFAFVSGSVAVFKGTVGLAGSGADCTVNDVETGPDKPFVIQSLSRSVTVG